MRILYIHLVNFVGVQAAMGLRDVSFSFEDVDKPIIQLYGKNRCGKTVLIQQLHPFSSISLSGDERNDLSLIIPGENGLKEIVYEYNGKKYHITHTYKSTPKTHTVTSSIMCDGVELNENGGVNNFNQIIENIFGINKYRFQFVINGTQLTSFANMSSTQRKTLLNRAMGIDIYDKIHKLATDDYRYTNKLIASLANTQEYLLKTYGSYETLQKLLSERKIECDGLRDQQADLKSRIDQISGKLQTLRAQNPTHELIDINRQCERYQRTSELFGGTIDPSLYDSLVTEQIQLNQQLSEKKNAHAMVLRDIDDCYSKKHDIESRIQSQQRALSDLQNLRQMKYTLKEKIQSIEIIENVETPSGYLRSMLSLGQAINSICKDIVTGLSEKQMILFADMVEHDIDIAAFLIKEGSVLMDSAKEKSVVSRFQSMLQNITGDDPKECSYGNCVYRNTYETMNQYFRSYHSSTETGFTTYDMEQFDSAYKSLQTIKRMLSVEIPSDIRSMFHIKTIVKNIANGRVGVDVNRIQFLMEESAKNEQRLQYIKQLSDIDTSIESLEAVIPEQIENPTEQLSDKIQSSITQRDLLKESIQALQLQIDEIDRRRLMLSDIKNLDISTLLKRKHQLEKIVESIEQSDAEYTQLSIQYQSVSEQLQSAQSALDVLEKANAQYMKTISEIELHSSNDQMYKIIAEATSSTKGKPVTTIRDTIHHAMNMTNSLLRVMYENEIQLLKPTINETEFTLPFRCGVNESEDIRYGSQSENTLLSLALSLSLASTMTSYNVYLIDELDAYLDANARDGFVMMLQEIMIKLNVEQLFVISHSVGADQYPHAVYTIDISKQILKMKGGK